MKITKYSLTPTKSFIGIWGLALFLSYIAVILGQAQEVYLLQDPEVHQTLTIDGLVWISVAIFIFYFGTFIANRCQITFRKRTDTIDIDQNQKNVYILQSSIRYVYLFTVVCLAILIYWTIDTIIKIGGPSEFVYLISNNWAFIRNYWPDQKPFFGARLMYTGLISVLIYSMVSLSVLSNAQGCYQPADDIDNLFLKVKILLSLAIIQLSLLPLLVSQRLLIATALAGGISGYVIISTSGISMRFPVMAILIGMMTWTSQEVVRANSSPDGLIASLGLGVNRLLFYFSNNVGNVNRAVSYVDQHTYGYNIFPFLFDIINILNTSTYDYIVQANNDASLYLAGGTFTAIGAPYVEFGYFGLIVILLWGYICQLSYLRASDSFLWAQIYGLMFGSIILSFQTMLWVNPLFWFNIILLIIFAVFIPKLNTKLYIRSNVQVP